MSTEIPEKTRRVDGFVNVLTGLGNRSRDKREWASIVRTQMVPAQAEEAWLGDFLMSKVVEQPVDDMLRGGLSVRVQEVEAADVADPDLDGDPRTTGPRVNALPGMLPPAPKPKPKPLEIDGSGKILGDLIDAKLEDLGLTAKLVEALKCERGTGGALILIGADDGASSLAAPLNLDAVKSVLFLTVFSAQDAYPIAYFSDPGAARYGEPELYRITTQMLPTNVYGGGQKAHPSMVDVHESRLVVLPGIQTTRRERVRRNGWGMSVVERVLESVRDFRSGMQSASALLGDFSQAVLKIKGLADIYQSNDEELIRARMAGIEMGRSVLRAVLLDSDGEDFERKSTPLTGLPEVLDRLANQVASAASMPVTLLFGQAPAGLNATGASDVRGYYDAIASRRELSVKPAVERIVRIVMRSKSGPTDGVEPETWNVHFPPLWQSTALETAQERKTVAETDAIYIGQGVVTPEEVAVSRFGGDEYSAETVLDLDAREAMAEVEAEPVVDPVPVPVVDPVPVPVVEPVPEPSP